MAKWWAPQRGGKRLCRQAIVGIGAAAILLQGSAALAAGGAAAIAGGVGVAMLGACWGSAWAQRQDATQRGGASNKNAKDRGSSTFTLQWENDFFNGNDGSYTNGVAAACAVSAEPGTTFGQGVDTLGLREWFFKPDVTTVSVRIGQLMFTPEKLDLDPPDDKDRPYAGYLYAGFGLDQKFNEPLNFVDRLFSSWELQVGVVGPHSYAREVQDDFHALIDSDRGQGWDHQLKDEPALNLFYSGVATLKVADALGLGALKTDYFDIRPHWGAALGNVLTYGSVGVTARVGRLPDGPGPDILYMKALPPPSDKARPWSAYFFGGRRLRVVGHNIFLDGNTFRDSASVDKEIVVHDWQAGFAVEISGFRFSYTHVWRSNEFKRENDDPGERGFGAFTVGWNWEW